MKKEEKSKISKVPLNYEIWMFLILVLLFIFSFDKALQFRSNYINSHETYLLVYGIQTWFCIRMFWFLTILYVGQKFIKDFLINKKETFENHTYFQPKHIDVIQFAHKLPIHTLRICVVSMIKAMQAHYKSTGCTHTLVIVITKESKDAIIDALEIKNILSIFKLDGINVIVQPQGREINNETRGEYESGKRGAWAKALDLLLLNSFGMKFLPEETGLAVFDGDSEVPKESYKTFFKEMFAPLNYEKGIVATTINNHVYANNESYWTIQMFSFRFLRRNFIMSAIPNVLTGRGSAFLGIFTRDKEFKDLVASDLIDHKTYKKSPDLFKGSILFFPFKLVILFFGLIINKLVFKTTTGDDKSTIYYILKKGYDIIYNPFLYIVCHEDLPVKTGWFPKWWFFQLPYYSVRYCRNTLNNNPRLLVLGHEKLGILRYLLIFNDRFIFWSPLVGLLSVPYMCYLEGADYFWLYISWVIFSRTFMTLVICYVGKERWSAFYPLLLYNDHTMVVFVKLWALISPISNWTRQSTVTVIRKDTYLNVFKYITVLLFISTVIGISSGVLQFDRVQYFFYFWRF